MNFDQFEQSDWVVGGLLVVLGVLLIIAITVIAKTFANDAKERKEREARQAEEEKAIPHEPQVAKPAPAKPAPAQPAAAKKKAEDLASKESDAESDLVAAAEVYLTYELKDQAILSLEKHLLKNPTDKRALDLLKKAEAEG